MKDKIKTTVKALIISLITIAVALPFTLTIVSLYALASDPVPVPPIAPLQQVQVPVGGIILWPGTPDTVPAGWQICDGTNGTRDLRNVFVVGAGDEYIVHDTGGAITSSHDHSINITQLGASGGTFVYGTATRTEPQVLDNRPPYHALYFIMRLE